VNCRRDRYGPKISQWPNLHPGAGTADDSDRFGPWNLRRDGGMRKLHQSYGRIDTCNVSLPGPTYSDEPRSKLSDLCANTYFRVHPACTGARISANECTWQIVRMGFSALRPDLRISLCLTSDQRC